MTKLSRDSSPKIPSIWSCYKNMFYYQKKYSVLMSALFICIVVGVAYDCLVLIIFKSLFNSVFVYKLSESQ